MSMMRRFVQVLLSILAVYGVVVSAETVLRARLVAPPPTALLVDRSGEFMAEVGGSDDADLGYWPIDVLPSRVARATIAIEDRRFDRHVGVDPWAIARAIVGNWRAGRRVSGASTLAMQIARMQAPGPRTIHRKIVEAMTGTLLTLRYGRDAVLRHYLVLAPYGNRIHGIRYAARRYLDKPVEDLSWAEIAFLAAIPQAPGRMNPLEESGYRRAIERGARILALLEEARVMQPEEIELAKQQLRDLPMPYVRERPRYAVHAVLHIARALREAPETWPMVQTTIDLSIQGRATEAVRHSVERWSDHGAMNAALLIVERDTGAVRAYVGSSDYFDEDRLGAIDYAEVPRPIASTIKPFLYGIALDRGVITPVTLLEDVRRDASGVENADDRFLGPILPRMALGNSRNVPAVEILNRLGRAEFFDRLADFGLHDRRESAGRYGAGLAIGALPVSLERLTAAYLTLAQGGKRTPLRYVEGTSTRESECKPLLLHRTRHGAPDGKTQGPGRADHRCSGLGGDRLLSSETAHQLALFLSDPEARVPSFPRRGSLEYPFPVAVKTGTSQGFRDAWTVAWSKRWLVAAWVGRPDAQPMHHLSGVNSAALLVRAMMLDLHEGETDGLRDLAFPAPPDLERVEFCPLSGLRAEAHCPSRVTEWVRRSDIPVEACDVHVPMVVDRRSGAPATASTEAKDREARVFVSLAPRYQRWMMEAGLDRTGRAAKGAADKAVQRWRGHKGRSSGGTHEGVFGELSAAEETVPVILSPVPKGRYIRDPEAPPGTSTIPLEAIVDPGVKELLWWVDGRPFRVAHPPFVVRWPLEPGLHEVKATIPMTGVASQSVRIRVD